MHKDLSNPHYTQWLRFLQRAEFWSSERIREWQLRKLREVIALALRTPGYRTRFAPYFEGLHTFKEPEDLRKLPTITKLDMMSRVEDFTFGYGDYVTTGGTTGHPFGFYRSWLSFSRELASKAHQYRRVGWKEGDKQIVFRGLVIKDLIEEVRDLCELRCSTYHLTEEMIPCYVEAAWRYSPKWLKCYPSAGWLLARHLKNLNIRFPPLKGILLASENVYDFQLKEMKEVFDCKIFSHYGHYECAALAGWCENTNDYHVLPFYGYVELLRPGRMEPVQESGEIGEIVATSFVMDTTLFVRYRTGDLAVLKGWYCPQCGRPYQIWSKVEGRAHEFIVTRTGRLISMTCINMHDDVFDPFWEFQFRQEKPGEVEFCFVPRGKVSEFHLNKAKEALKRKLGDDVDLKLVEVDYIERTRRGKHRFLVQKCEVPLP